MNVGHTPGESVPQQFLVTRQDIAKFSTAIGYPMSPGAGAPVPVMFYLTMGMARGRILTREQLGVDGLPAEETALGGRFMAAGTEVWFHEDLAVGDVVTVRQKILADMRKTGRHGDFRLVTVQREYLGEDGQLVIDERYTRVVR